MYQVQKPLFSPVVSLSSHQIKHGPTFTFVVIGRAVAPSLDFSFAEFNFGKCFLYCPGMVLSSQTLVISNKGDLDIRCVLRCRVSLLKDLFLFYAECEILRFF